METVKLGDDFIMFHTILTTNRRILTEKYSSLISAKFRTSKSLLLVNFIKILKKKFECHVSMKWINKKRATHID